MTEFKKYGKTPRLEKLFENVIITEKIDGTNASIKIENSEIEITRFWYANPHWRSNIACIGIKT